MSNNYYNGVPGAYLPKGKEIEEKIKTSDIKIVPCSEHIYLPKVAQFEKVPYEQFEKDILNNNCLENPEQSQIKELYDSIKLPNRATIDSAGYDFHSPMFFRLKRGKSVIIPTGIRCKMNTGWWLMLVPRSGSGFKYKVQLYNTIGVIDGR
jgi:dUTP pyrophosphatase